MKKIIQLSLVWLGSVMFFVIVQNQTGHAYADNYDSFNDAYDRPVPSSTVVYLNTDHDYDYLHFEVPFTLNGKAAYNIYSEYTSSNLDVLAYLYEWQGVWPFDYKEQIGFSDDDGYGRNFRFEVDLDSMENYFLKVRPYSRADSGTSKIIIEENLDTRYSETGGLWIANHGTYSNGFPGSELLYLTPEQVNLYYFAQFNPTLWEQVETYIFAHGVSSLLETGLGTVLITSMGIAALPAGIAAGIVTLAFNIVIDIFVPSPEEKISETCGSPMYSEVIDGERVNYVNCTYGTQVLNNDFTNMNRYDSKTLVGLIRHRGTFFIDACPV